MSINRDTMKYTYSRDKAFKDLEWILFIVFTILAGWFASSVLQQFFSSKTNFTQHEEKITKYPVVVIFFNDLKASKVNLNNLEIHYEVKGMQQAGKLEIGKNYFHNDDFNKTEKVILESLESHEGYMVFRIIHSTPIHMNEGFPPEVKIILNTDTNVFENSDSEVAVYLTSPDNSPGFYGDYWTDGKPYQISMIKNSVVKCNIQAQITNYLEQTDKCQKESYSKCIASRIDAIELFNECSKKCMPNTFANMGKYFTTPFCQKDTDSQLCITEEMKMINDQDEGRSKCKKSCSIKEYTGENYLRYNLQKTANEMDEYYFKYRLHDVNSTKIYDEYLIYDGIGMVGSVGGTLGMFIELN